MTAATIDALDEEIVIPVSDGSVRIAISGTFAGTLTLAVKDRSAADAAYRDQRTYTAVTAPDDTIEIFGPTSVRLKATAWTSGSAAVDLRARSTGAGGNVSAANQVAGNASLDSIDDKTPALVSGASQTYAFLSSPSQVAAGIVAKMTPFGELTVTAPVVPQFTDNFDFAIDTVDRWTLSGTTPPTNVNGSITLSLTAANSVSSVAISQPTFSPSLQAFVLAAQMGIGSQQSNPNAHRFFGQGVVTSYASATPLTNGFGVEVDLTGALNFVVYIAGVRYVVNSTDVSLITAPGGWAANMTMSTYGQTITWPASGVLTVVMRYVNGTVFFYTSSGSGITFDVPVGVASFVPAVVQLPIRFAAITTPAVSTVLATTFTGSGLVLGGPLGNIITDPTYPFRGVTVKKASTAAVAADLAQVVALHPTSPLPVGTNAIGSVTVTGGQTGHSSAATGAPVRIGGRVAPAAIDTTLAVGDATDQIMEFNGGSLSKPYSASTFDWQATSGLTALATTTLTALTAAGAASVRNYCTTIQLVNTSAAVSTTVTILDGSTVLWTGFLPATTAALPVVPVHAVFPTPLRGTAATAMNIQLGTTAANVYYNAQGYKAM